MTPARAAAPHGTWDHAGYDAEDSYYNPHESVLNLSTIGALTPRWTVTLRKHPGGACAGYSAPLAAAGRVIATDQLGISAFDFASGTPAWHYNWPDPLDTETPFLAADSGVLIAATSDCNSQSDPDGMLFAVDLATGRLRWQAKVDAPVFTLAVDKGVAVVSGNSPSDQQMVVAYRVADGHVAWRKPNYESSGVSANGRLLVTDAHVTSAVNITTGVPLWTANDVWRAAAATPSSDRFLVTNVSSLSAVNATTGALMWTAPGATNDLLATDGRRVFRADGGSIEARSMSTGHLLWTRLLPGKLAQPVRAGGLLYLGGPILDPATGALVAPKTTGNLIITGGRLITANKGSLSSYAP
jgi:outer membrane protein assembly factor BamB